LIVIDASVLANVVGDDGPDGIATRARLAAAGAASVPELAFVETVAVLRKRWIAKTITEARFRAAVDDLVALPLQTFPLAALLHRVFELRANISAYDATYVAVAEALRCTLVTADGRLANATGPLCRIEHFTV
jgi:predicted nucleic acid-binding protein